MDHGYKWSGVNGLVALAPLIVPIFAVPMLDNEVESYVDLFVIDTRNGYLYGHVTEDEKSGPRYATLYARSPETIADENWGRLRAKASTDLVKLLAEERAQAKRLPPAESAAVAPASSPSSAPTAGTMK
jgi:hypothetical protein